MWGRPRLVRYAVCITGRKTKHAQDAVLELNETRAAAGEFLVELIYWEDIALPLDSDDDFREQYQVSSHSSVRGVVRPEIERAVAPVRARLDDVLGGLEAVGATGIDAELDLADACRRAGISTVSPNDLRRTFGTWLRLQGVAPHFIGVAMGHADSRMVERVYGRMPEENLRAALNEHVDPCSKYVANTVAKGRRERRMRRPNPSIPSRDSVPRAGIEPATRGFSILCSTN